MLLIEDEKTRQEQLSALLTQFNHTHSSVSDSQEAIGFFETGGYASVLITSYKPGLLAELEVIRGLQDGYLPVLLICDHMDDSIVEACRSSEIDGVVVRPIDQFLLKSTIISVLRMGQVRDYEREQRKQLLEHWQRIELEHEVAVKIYNNVLCKNLLITDVVRSVISPMALFNGDVLFVAKTPENHLYLLLGDFTGHGLSASIAAIPTADIFYGMTQKGFELGDIISEINDKLYKMLPTNMFLAATATALYPDSKSLSLITCGLPEHYLVDKRDGSYRVIASKNIPLGIQASYPLKEQHFSVTGDQQLFMFTDGVFEAENGNGEAFGSERVVQAICHSQAGLDDLRAKLNEHCLSLGQQDDISLVKLVCDVENAPWRNEETHHQARVMKATSWKSSMEFEIDALREISPVPVMVNALMDIQGLQDHRQSIFMIVNELFANALDHGLLELDSQIKSTPDGFMNFYMLKEERLQNCNTGRIRFQFSHQPIENGGRLIIKVMDSGAGFGWQQMQQLHLTQNSGFNGRGLNLVETLCSSLTYHGKGNRVTAVFDW
jgi:serine phosphatase RsbU (regulator of sigma subunit)